MKLTKRGKRARALLILAGLILGVWAVLFYTSHHRVYDKCYQTPEGWACDLVGWVHN